MAFIAAVMCILLSTTVIETISMRVVFIVVALLGPKVQGLGLGFRV